MVSPYQCITVTSWWARWRQNHQPRHCLLNRLSKRRSKKTSKLRVIGLCVGNSPVTGEFPAQMASNAENDSIWWRHHVLTLTAPLLILRGDFWSMLNPAAKFPNVTRGAGCTFLKSTGLVHSIPVVSRIRTHQNQYCVTANNERRCSSQLTQVKF